MQPARIGIDFGTSHTVAVLSRPDGRADAVLFEASPLLPSAVYLGVDDTILVGRDAERSARIEPAAYEPHPKRRIDETSVLLDGREVPVGTLIEAILRRVGEEAGRILGGSPGATVLTHPAGWGPTRRGLLQQAAAAAGLTGVTLVSEPVAAAMYFTGVLGHRVPDGHAVVVYDFGGGTFDISVVRRAGDGWTVAAANGLDDVGGIDLDAAVVDWIHGRVAGGPSELWQRLEQPATVADRRHRRVLWEDARSAKELLSRATSAGLAVPLFDVDLYLTRPEFEILARPWLDRTVSLTTATLFASDVTIQRLAGVFLVGGASRVPLVATLLHQALGIAPVVLEQPELVVAYGSLLVDGPVAAAMNGGRPAAVPAQPTARTAEPAPAPVSPRPMGVASVSAPPVSAVPGPPTVAPVPQPFPVSGPLPVSPVSPPSGPLLASPVSPPSGPLLVSPVSPASGPPPAAPASGAAPARTAGRALLITLAVVAGLGLLSLLALQDDQVVPPFLAGLLTPLQPKPVLVLLAMMTAVVVGGTPGAPRVPAYRALGPAMVAAGGAVVGLLLFALAVEPDRALSMAGGSSWYGRPYSAGALWIVAAAAVAVILAAAYRIARPPAADPVAVPAGRRARLAWFGAWAAAGALMVLATSSVARREYDTFGGDPVSDVAPLRGVLGAGGALAWWGTYLLALTLILGAALLLAAALRAAVVRDPVVHHGARPTGFMLITAAGVLLLLNVVWERSEPQLLNELHRWYWQTFVRLGAPDDGHPAVLLILVIGAVLAVAVPSLIQARTAHPDG